ncbi:MAG: sugar ABC transporter permease [Spirochaetia bacterium]|nr:sugar ABC transporter permease [Spirochaetia bacterium]
MLNSSRWTPYYFIFPALLGLAIFRLGPIFVSVFGSFTMQTLQGETVFTGLSNYIELFGESKFWHSTNLTIRFNLFINPLQVLIAFFLALLVRRSTFGVGFFRTAYFLPMTTSLAVASILWKLMLDPNIGLVNGALNSIGLSMQPFFTGPNQALGSLIWLASWKGVGYWMMFLLVGLNDIPNELYEAARIDGASGGTILKRITLPLMKRSLAFVLIADTVVNFLFFAPIYIITKGGPLGSTSLLMYEAYRSAFVLLDLGRSLSISTVILMIIGVFAFFELRVLRQEE